MRTADLTSQEFGRLTVIARCGYEVWETDKVNATLIAAAVNALPALLDRSDRLAALEDGLRGWCDRWSDDALSRLPLDQRVPLRRARDSFAALLDEGED